VPPLLEGYSIERLPQKELHWKTLSEYKSARVEVDKVLERVVDELDSY